MDQATQLLALIAAAGVGLLAVLVLLQRERAAEPPANRETFAASTEGMLRCPHCGVGNLVTDRDCSACSRRLPT